MGDKEGYGQSGARSALYVGPTSFAMLDMICVCKYKVSL